MVPYQSQCVGRLSPCDVISRVQFFRCGNCTQLHFLLSRCIFSLYATMTMDSLRMPSLLPESAYCSTRVRCRRGYPSFGTRSTPAISSARLLTTTREIRFCLVFTFATPSNRTMRRRAHHPGKNGLHRTGFSMPTRDLAILFVLSWSTPG